MVDPQKLHGYVLNPDHPIGRHKARRFAAALGFTEENWQVLRRAILQGLADHPVGAVEEGYDEYTWNCDVDMRIIGPNGNAAVVRTKWELGRDPKPPTLITVFVKTRGTIADG